MEVHNVVQEVVIKAISNKKKLWLSEKSLQIGEKSKEVQGKGEKERYTKLNAQSLWASLVAQTIKNLPAMPETWVRFLVWEDPLEKGKATHSSILA